MQLKSVKGFSVFFSECPGKMIVVKNQRIEIKGNILFYVSDEREQKIQANSRKPVMARLGGNCKTEICNNARPRSGRRF